MSLKTLTTKERLVPATINDLLKPWEEWFNMGKPLLNGEWPSLSMPAVNIAENKNGYHISLAAPGLKKEDFKLNVEGDLLTISSEKERNKEETEQRYTRKEYNYSSFSRTFTLPAEVIKDKIDAHYENGILDIKLPKTEAAQKNTARSIPVN